MKFVISIFLFFLCSVDIFASNNCEHFYYESASKYIEIKYCCEEGELDCDDIYYKSIDKKNNSVLVLKGKTLNDFISKRFLGYEFNEKNFTYTIINNILRTYDNDELLLEEEISPID